VFGGLSNIFVDARDIDAEGFNYGYATIFGGRIGRVLLGEDFYVLLKGGEYNMTYSPFFLVLGK